MNLKKIAFVAAATLTAAFSFAQAPDRTFDYTPIQFVDADYSADGDVTLESTARATVLGYLYVVGNLGAEWTIEGWGRGEDERSEDVLVYHNEALSLILKDFDDLKKVSGSQNGDQSIAQLIKIEVFNAQNDKQLIGTDLVPAKEINNDFNGQKGLLKAEDSDGMARLRWTRRIQVTPGVGPGVYENKASVTITRN